MAVNTSNMSSTKDSEGNGTDAVFSIAHANKI
jgi:hypothetical protein